MNLLLDGGVRVRLKAMAIRSNLHEQGAIAALRDKCDTLVNEEFTHCGCDHLFHCGAGNGSFTVGCDGRFRLCSSLQAPGTTYDLRTGALAKAWNEFVPAVRDLRSQRREFLETCRKCALVNLCLWCPAHAHLETGELDGTTPYFCEVARLRAANLVGHAVGTMKPCPPYLAQALRVDSRPVPRGRSSVSAKVRALIVNYCQWQS